MPAIVVAVDDLATWIIANSWLIIGPISPRMAASRREFHVRGLGVKPGASMST
jgi:hypothetical protein